MSPYEWEKKAPVKGSLVFSTRWSLLLCCSRSHDNAKEKGDKQYQSRDAKLQLSFKMSFTLT